MKTRHGILLIALVIATIGAGCANLRNGRTAFVSENVYGENGTVTIYYTTLEEREAMIKFVTGTENQH